jgi:TonB-dependent receptor
MKKSLLILLLSFVSYYTFAQSNLSGKVIDIDSNPVPGAYVYIENTKQYDLTDSEGNFKLFNISVGKSVMVISYVGYEDYKEEISLVDKQNLYKEIVLSDTYKLEEIIINSSIDGQAKALNMQKNSNSITQIVSSEQIEKFPDANIGDALKRLPGINVQYDQGEARFANIRGTSPELNSITVNGDRVPSAEAEKRYVQLDLIPADMIGKIEVHKAVTPDMDADAIGGSINLETEKASAKQKISGTIGSGYSVLTEKPIYRGQLSYSNRFNDGALGLILEASILDKTTRSDDVEPFWDYTDENNKDASAYTSELQVRQYYVERLRKSFSATMDFQLDKNHNIYFTGMYNHRNDWENRYRLEYKDIEEDGGEMIAEIRRQTKGGSSDHKNARLEDQRMLSLKLGGSHFFNKIKLEWAFSSMRANEDRPNERYIMFREKDAVVLLDKSDMRRPMVTPIDADLQDFSDEFSFKELSEQFQDTKEKDINNRIDLEIPLLFGANSSFLKVGTRMKLKNKYRLNTFEVYEPTSANEDSFEDGAYDQAANHTNSNFSAGNYTVGSFVSNSYLGGLDLSNTSLFEGEVVNEELAVNFDAKENVYAGYVMYTQNIGEKYTLLGGLRLEHTDLVYSGKIYDANTDELTDSGVQKDNYNNILPSVHLKYSPNKSMNIRMAYTNTLARPNYYDIVPYQNIDSGDNIISVGNPELVPTTSMNLDLLGEYFFKNVGVISAGVFYKDLSNVIANKNLNDYTFQGNMYDIFTQPINAGNAKLYGIEVGIQRRLDFLPSFLSKLSVFANYTYNKSELKDIKLEGREDEVLPLAGTPKSLINASLAYDTKKFEMRVSYSYADEFVEEFGEEAFYDRWYDKVNYLDVNADYQITKNWKFYVSLENLLNQPLRYYQGISDRTQQAEYYGINAKLGIKFKF